MQDENTKNPEMQGNPLPFSKNQKNKIKNYFLQNVKELLHSFI